MDKIRIVGTGTRAVLMHNIRLASPMDPYAKQLKELNAKRSKVKTDEDRIEIARTEWQGGLYWSEATGPYIPGSWLFKCLVEGARLTRAGKKIERGVQISDLEIPLLYTGPRDLESMWGDNGQSPFVDFRSVRVGAARVDRCRPIFHSWKFATILDVDPGIIDLDELVTIARDAGAMVGMGDYRQQYGRFEAEVTKV